MINDSAESQLHEIANLRDPAALYIEVISRCESHLRKDRVLANRRARGVLTKSTSSRDDENLKRTAKGIIAIMKRLLLVVAVAALAAHAAYSRGQATDSTRQVKAGEVIQFGDSLTVRVTKSPKSQFSGVKLKGEPVVVVIDFDGGKQGATLSYKLTADPRTSDLHLASGAQRLAPLALIEDFPSWGKDNDKEVEVLNPKESGGGVILTFGQKGSVTLLFDVPAEQAKTALKFSMTLRTVKPKDEQHSFVVSM